MKLNEIQQKIVNHINGPLLVLAGAGSGKTTTITARNLNLINNHNVRLQDILSLTFTNKAAKEMQKRLLDKIDTSVNLNSLWITTFHSFGAKFLRFAGDELSSINLDKKFSIIDDKDSKKLIKKLLKENGMDHEDWEYFQSKMDKVKNLGLWEETFIGSELDDDKNFTFIYQEYQRVLKNNNLIDFGDLLVKTLELLTKNKNIREKYQEKFKYITVDEYQDTNQVQFEIVKILADKYKNICVVGDEDQCIYSWRHANIENILNFESDFSNAKVYKLEENYRSNDIILEAANSVIENNKERKGKVLWTSKKSETNLQHNRYPNGSIEASEIIKKIKEQIDDGIDPNEIAIFYRNNHLSRKFEEQLTKNMIPYKIYGGTKFYDRKEIKDILSYLSVINNPKNDIALERIINTPSRGIGPKALENIKKLEGINLWDKINKLKTLPKLDGLSKKAKESTISFVEMIKAYQKNLENGMDVDDLYQDLLNKSGYYDFLHKKESMENQNRWENLLELGTALQEEVLKNIEFDLSEYLEKVSLDPGNDGEDHEKINLMTFHSAKGLEFNIVFMVALEENFIPGPNKFSNLEEERRLFYVGITRARDLLFLSHTKERRVFNELKINMKCRFINEIPDGLMDYTDHQIEDHYANPWKKRYSWDD